MLEQVNRYGFNWVLLLYIRQHAGHFRRRTNVNDVIDNSKINCQLSMARGERENGLKTACFKKECEYAYAYLRILVDILHNAVNKAVYVKEHFPPDLNSARDSKSGH
jgi:hypothetical protein